MSQTAYATRAYQAVVSRRDPREQEAELFRLINVQLREARDKDPLARVAAICDNRRLWALVLDLARDPANALPAELRGGLVSVAMAVRRELDKDNPDFDWMMSINESIAAGLDHAE
jgi:flagellar biosynthesis regulator FlaF